MLERYRYDAFGQPTVTNVSTSQTGTSSFFNNPILFTGREWEPEAQVYSYRARYYNPTTGRFLSRDPLGIAPDLNLYRYVGNNPLNWIDPLGMNVMGVNPTPVWDGPHVIGPRDVGGNDGPHVIGPVSSPEQGPHVISPQPPKPPGGPDLIGPKGRNLPRPEQGSTDCPEGLKGTDQPGMSMADPTPQEDEEEDPRSERDKKKDREKKPNKSSEKDDNFIEWIVDELGLSERERSRLHREISKQGYSEDVVRQIAEDIKHGRL